MATNSVVEGKFREAIKHVLQPPVESKFLIIDRRNPDFNSGRLAYTAFEAAQNLGLDANMIELTAKKPYATFPSRVKKAITSGIYPRAMGFFCYPEETDMQQKETPARVELVHGFIKHAYMGYLHAPGMTWDMASHGAVQCDYEKMAKRAEKMLQKLNGVKTVSIVAPAGTDINVELPTEVKFETDCICVPPDAYGNPGKICNLPIGEAEALRRIRKSLAGEEVEYPVKLIGNGKLVCDVCADGIDKLIEPDKPIEISFRNGVVERFHTTDDTFQALPKEWVEREAKYGLKPILEEVAFGLNDKAREVKELLEAEKKLGTIHAAVGHVKSHSDFVVRKPTVNLTYTNGNQELLIKDGELKLD